MNNPIPPVKPHIRRASSAAISRWRAARKFPSTFWAENLASFDPWLFSILLHLRWCFPFAISIFSPWEICSVCIMATACLLGPSLSVSPEILLLFFWGYLVGRGKGLK